MFHGEKNKTNVFIVGVSQSFAKNEKDFFTFGNKLSVWRFGCLDG